MKFSNREKQQIEAQISGLPLCSYTYLPVRDLPFSERVRYICETECPQYGTSWSCPPAVGSVSECRERLLRYEEAFVFTTVSEVEDMQDLEAMLACRRGHEEITRQITEIFQKEGCETLTLSTESCVRCRHCTYPDAPCRHPELMFPCVESYGIVVVQLAEKCKIPFMQQYGVVTWFSVIALR